MRADKNFVGDFDQMVGVTDRARAGRSCSIGRAKIVSISRVLVGVCLRRCVDRQRRAAADDPIPGNPLIAIPAGPFVFGNDDGNDNERPRRVVEGKAFAINRTEITNAQYQRFVDATGHRSAFYGGHPFLGLDDRPVVGVSLRRRRRLLRLLRPAAAVRAGV